MDLYLARAKGKNVPYNCFKYCYRILDRDNHNHFVGMVHRYYSGVGFARRHVDHAVENSSYRATVRLPKSRFYSMFGPRMLRNTAPTYYAPQRVMRPEQSFEGDSPNAAVIRFILWCQQLAEDEANFVDTEATPASDSDVVPGAPPPPPLPTSVSWQGTSSRLEAIAQQMRDTTAGLQFATNTFTATPWFVPSNEGTGEVNAPFASWAVGLDTTDPR